MIESLQQSITSFQQENERLRGAIRGRLGESAAAPLLEKCSAQATSGSAELAQLTGPQSSATQSLDDHDYGLVRALQMAQQTFVITDPLLPDNPIVFASQGFLTLTGYSLDQVLCSWLQFDSIRFARSACAPRPWSQQFERERLQSTTNQTAATAAGPHRRTHQISTPHPLSAALAGAWP